MDIKLKIIARAVSIRINKGEELDAILSSYPNLNEEEKATLRGYFYSEKEN